MIYLGVKKTEFLNQESTTDSVSSGMFTQSCKVSDGSSGFPLRGFSVCPVGALFGRFLGNELSVLDPESTDHVRFVIIRVNFEGGETLTGQATRPMRSLWGFAKSQPSNKSYAPPDASEESEDAVMYRIAKDHSSRQHKEHSTIGPAVAKAIESSVGDAVTCMRAVYATDQGQLFWDTITSNIRVVMEALQGLSQVHPFLAVAYVPIQRIYDQVVLYRDNDKKRTLLFKTPLASPGLTFQKRQVVTNKIRAKPVNNWNQRAQYHFPHSSQRLSRRQQRASQTGGGIGQIPFHQDLRYHVRFGKGETPWERCVLFELPSVPESSALPLPIAPPFSFPKCSHHHEDRDRDSEVSVEDLQKNALDLLRY
ncbi:hypothetical protein K438DRAFT_1780593 [Mycena galopus ATCC 62051]|nr:hypothetical protein K438DRAFT_1780593 [Mycena galopus ATCC 62051]